MTYSQLLQGEWDLFCHIALPVVALIIAGGVVAWIYQRFYDR